MIGNGPQFGALKGTTAEQVSFLLTGIPVFGVLAWFAVATYRLYFHPLSTVPGPKLWAISILPWWWYTWRGTCVYEVKNLHDKYGKTVRIGPNEVSSISANIWKDVYGHRKSGGKSYDKDPRFLRPTKTGTTDLLSAADEDHARWRRTLSHAFSDGSLRNQEAVVKHYVDLLIKNLRAKADGQERIDMVSWYNFTTFDVIGDLAFGKSFNCLEKGGYHPFVELVIQIMPHTIMNQLAQFMPLLYPLRDYFVPASIMKDSLAMMKWAEDTAFERIDRDPVERDDFMSFILRHKDENLMTRDEMVENSTILIVGGSETTASVLSGTTYYLATNRPVYNKLVNEIRGTLEKEEDITIQRVNALPYLVAVFNEGMRLYPALVEGSPRNVPKGGEFVDGFWMPEGTLINLNMYAAFRSEQNWTRPDDMVPERWLDKGAGSTFEGDVREVHQPFSFGPRNCIGKNLANSEMRLVLARILWNFDITLLPESANWIDQKVYRVWVKGHLMCTLVPAARK